jgi:hypothetical protein
VLLGKIMNTYLRASWSIAAFVGTSAGVVHFLMGDRWARIAATGKPKFEMPTWWMVGESVIVGLLLALLVGGIGVGVRRLRCGIAPSQETVPNTRPDDPFGLNPGVTPQSIGGALFQTIGRFFRKH